MPINDEGRAIAKIGFARYVNYTYAGIYSKITEAFSTQM